MDLLVADLEDVVDERIEKLAVVRNHQDRAGIILEIILEPAERFEIEMVRRLVEHEQVGLHHEQPREVRAHDPAAAHRLGGAIEIGFAKGEAAQDALGLRLELVAAELGVTAQRVVVFLGVGLARARRLRRGCASASPCSGVMAVASSSTVSSPLAAVSCGR